MNLDKLKNNYKSGCSKKLSAWMKKLKILGKGYEIRSIRVDNDALAVFTAVQEARKIIVNEHKTILVEVNCTLFEIEAYYSCGSVVNSFFYVQQTLRKQIKESETRSTFARSALKARVKMGLEE
ncbi:hypothetical protein CQW23_29693 [Capsicum baccatum]|uniref:Dehydrogenase E1 component domain-containing protein n=1 Tax=Capsicum baccatum TaxID=33114 RepID=A0A2G2VCR9_CAPBA|nr:hypothetical protein CQW23_29693 [Capsicum baccatum]